MFAFLRLKSTGNPPIYLFIVAIIITFICSFFSYKYIETPFRKKTQFTKREIFKYTGISFAFLLIVGLAGHLKKGFPSRFDMPVYDSIKSNEKAECNAYGENYLRPSEACKYFGKKITWASFGDSHSTEIAYAFATILKEQNNDEGLVQLSSRGCRPALLYDIKSLGCSKWINESLHYLEGTKTIKNVIISFRHQNYIDRVEFINDELNNLDKKSTREIYWLSFDQIISRLINSGKHVYVIYPIPELPAHISRIITPFSIFENKPSINIEKTIRVEDYLNKNNFIVSHLNSISHTENVIPIMPLEIICDTQFCPAVLKEKALYMDNNHLSAFGARLIAEKITIKKF